MQTKIFQSTAIGTHAGVHTSSLHKLIVSEILTASLRSSQQEASSLTASVVRRAARSSPTVPCAIQGHVALNLRHRRRRAHMREQELRGVVLKGLATPQEDAKYDQRMARLVRAQVHACVWKKTSRRRRRNDWSTTDVGWTTRQIRGFMQHAGPPLVVQLLRCESAGRLRLVVMHVRPKDNPAHCLYFEYFIVWWERMHSAMVIMMMTILQACLY